MDLLGACWGGRSHPCGSGVRPCVMLGYSADVGRAQTYILRRRSFILHRETVLFEFHGALSKFIICHPYCIYLKPEPPFQSQN